jgi:RimJ/RimL family protein N-acetyltransferase
MINSQSVRVEFLSGEKVYLRPIEQGDIALLHQWANDPEIRGLTGEVRPSSYEGAIEFYQRIQKSEDRVWLAVVLRETNQVIGETGLLRMFPAWRTTDWSLIIGDKSVRGKGYGTAVAQLMLNYAFGHQNFHRVSIGVVGFNTKALKFYEQIGFRREGIQRDGYYYDHRYYDFVMMSMLEDDFREQWKVNESKQ